MKTNTLALLLGAAFCKEHFIVNESREDQQRVRATSNDNERCLFDLETMYGSGKYDRFCVDYQGTASMGFEWTQDIDDLDKTTKDGTYGLYFINYIKSEVYATIQFVLNRLYKAEISFDLQETQISHTTGFTYYIYENDLCMNIYSEITDFEYIT